MRRHLLLLLVLTVGMNAHAADTLSVADRSYERAIAWQHLWLRYTDQVALHHRQYRNSLSSFAARYEGRTETETLCDERGRGESIVRLRAKTYLLPSTREHLWGYADYANGRVKEVKWRSTSDYDRLYPYIMADESQIYASPPGSPYRSLPARWDSHSTMDSTSSGVGWRSIALSEAVSSG